jgi:hypothetical protein
MDPEKMDRGERRWKDRIRRSRPAKEPKKEKRTNGKS